MRISWSRAPFDSGSRETPAARFKLALPSHARDSMPLRQANAHLLELYSTMARRIWHAQLALLLAASALPLPYMGMVYAQDVRALCARIGTDDRLRGIPPALVGKARQIFSFSPVTPSAYVKKSTLFRCMDGKAWLCNYGANLVCGQANASRHSQGAAHFCQENPGSVSVPMAATGHDTIYEWKCAGTKAQISRQVEALDARGFLAGNWKQLD